MTVDEHREGTEEKRRIARLRAQVSELPRRPGVYIFRDSSGEVIYVGKAKSLKSRVSSYFGHGKPNTPKNAKMLKEISDIDYTVCDGEVDALILECNLIKKHKPPYNVFLRDDKSYPYVVITMKDDFPRVMMSRGRRFRGALYFGPYVNARAVRTTLGLLSKVFPVRHCRGPEPGRRDGSPCLYYHLGRCLGPCTGEVSYEEYDSLIKEYILFLKGKHEQILHRMNESMQEASDRLEFERAARIRNQLEAAEQVRRMRRSAVGSVKDRDIIGVARDHLQAYFILGQVREGSFLGNIGYLVDADYSTEDDELLGMLLKQYYAGTESIPPILSVPFPPREKSMIETWLSRRRGSKVKVLVPERGEGRRTLELAGTNARLALEKKKHSITGDPEFLKRALEGIRDAIGAKRVPHRIECYDISTLGGDESVGSMVVFQEGNPEMRSYRRFAIRSVEGMDDVAMMREVLTRRFLRHRAENLKELPPGKSGRDPAFSVKPDLLLVDGGLPQLGAAVGVLDEMGIEDVAVAALAKRLELLYTRDKAGAVDLSDHSPSLLMLQRIRDESHRFAITYHRKLRDKHMTQSWLDAVEGVGPARKRLLINRFGSPRNVSKASVEDIASVPGIPKKVAQAIYRVSHGNGR